MKTHLEGVDRDGDVVTLCGQAWAQWTTLEPAKVDCKACFRVLNSKAHAKRNPAKEAP
jgi:hypothetical protein